MLLFLVKEDGSLWNSSCAFTLEQNGVSAFILEGDGMFLFFRRTEALEQELPPLFSRTAESLQS